MKQRARTLASCLAATLALTAAGAAQAQAVRTECNRSPELPNQIAGATVAACLAGGYNVTAAVAGRAGQLRALQRADNAGAHTVEATQAKAYISGRCDKDFQGFGSTRSGPQGTARLRTIRPVAYPGRTPHIHLELRHAGFGEIGLQLFVAGDGGHARDFLWRGLAVEDRAALELRLQPATADEGLRWLARHALFVPA